VGQSKNIASIIATHMSGKYKAATKIEIFDVEDIGFSGFMNKTVISRSNILDNCEQYLMSILMPIENINIDMDCKVAEDKRPNILDDNTLAYSYRIIINNADFYITDTFGSFLIDGFRMDLEASQYEIKPYEVTVDDVVSSMDKITLQTEVHNV